jgi:hypothetical protein
MKRKKCASNKIHETKKAQKVFKNITISALAILQKKRNISYLLWTTKANSFLEKAQQFDIGGKIPRKMCSFLETQMLQLIDMIISMKKETSKFQLLFQMLQSDKTFNLSINMLTPFRGAKYSRRTGGGALWSGVDGPRHRAGRSATWRRSSGFLPDGRTVRALGPDGPRVRRGGGRSPAAPGSRSREGPRRGGDILEVV